MKPIIIVVPSESSKIELTKAELEKMLDESYNAGYKDGNKYIPVYPYTYPAYIGEIRWPGKDIAKWTEVSCGDSCNNQYATCASK